MAIFAEVAENHQIH